MNSSPFVDTVGWALVHSLWLLMIPALTLFLWSRGFPKSSASSRYWVALVALLMMPALAVGWLMLTWPTKQTIAAATLQDSGQDHAPSLPADLAKGDTDYIATSSVVDAPELPLELAPELAKTRTVAADLLPSVVIAPPQPLSISQQATQYIQPRLPIVVTIWFIGVVALSIRTFIGLQLAFRLKRRGLQSVDGSIQRCFEQLSEQLGVHHGVRVMQSALVKVPCVIGHFAPVVLLPDWTERGRAEGDSGA